MLTTQGSSPAAWLEFSISSSAGPEVPVPLRENCRRGLMRIDYQGNGGVPNEEQEERAAVSSSLSVYRAAVAACMDELPADDYYRDLLDVGLEFGPTHGVGQIESSMDLFDQASSRRYVKVRGYVATAAIATDRGGNSDVKPGLAYFTRWETSFDLADKDGLANLVAEQVAPDDKVKRIVAMIPPRAFVYRRRKSPIPSQQRVKYALLDRSEAPDVCGGSILEMEPGQHVVCLVELENPLMDRLGPSDFDLFRNLVGKAGSLLWVTALSGLSAYVIDGPLRVARRELSNQRLKVLHLSSIESDPALAAKVVMENHQLNAKVSSYAGTGTHKEPIKSCGLPMALGISKPGLLDTLRFAPKGEPTELKDHEIEFQVKTSGLNFRDIMISMGLLNYAHLGFESAGVVLKTGSKVTNVRAADRVRAHVFGSHANITRTMDAWCSLIPDTMSFEEGASLPVIFTTAYHALVNLAKLRPKQSVLIHAAAEGVGQADIQIAKYLNVGIFATVGSQYKKQLIMDTYGIPENHIFSSRNASFLMGV
ncbi:uncharacterized protein PpBr36_10649 [Pyricularia pennisetigena]|uniref:uncharacterized protein n=1 Tax=Pyricularia pennisetigena TaxID=1578925 RepID=UPI0011511822|nr:uncharacterized protein PpBr36_10649 [Pyricularia pennisetigena]TLS21071.1 hypothetical protein PpBr36_10649 [Pyricularia pennisetigena]